MHLTETTLDIIQLLGEEPFSGESIRSLAQQLNKAYPLVHDHITRLNKEGLILQEKKGKATSCTLNFSNPQAQLLLGYTTTRQQKQNALTKQVRALNNEQRIITACHNNNHVWLITDNKKQQQELKTQLPYTGVHILTTKEFTLFLLEQARKNELPQPILHPATFYDFIGGLQQALNASWRADNE